MLLVFPIQQLFIVLTFNLQSIQNYLVRGSAYQIDDPIKWQWSALLMYRTAKRVPPAVAANIENEDTFRRGKILLSALFKANPGLLHKNWILCTYYFPTFLVQNWRANSLSRFIWFNFSAYSVQNLGVVTITTRYSFKNLLSCREVYMSRK